MKAIIEALAGLSGAEPVIIALVALVIFALVFRQISRTLREAIADEQMPLRKAVQYLWPLVAAVFVIAIILMVVLVLYWRLPR